MRIGLWIVCCAALNLAAAEGPRKVKPAWEWTTDERLTARLAPDSPARQRVSSNTATRRAGEEYFQIDGRKHPELFLPWELFNSLMSRVSDERDLAHARQLLDHAIENAGWQPDQFWATLARFSEPYFAAQAERFAQQERLPSLSPPARRAAEANIERLNAAQCRARAAALAAAREHFGTAFDRFLYTAVAPSIGISSALPEPDAAQRLRHIEGGCQ